MGNAVRNAIMRALIEGVITDLMVKTSADNVYIDDTTTLAAKLSEVIVSLNGKATNASLNAGLAGKANTSHKHQASDIDGLSDVLSGMATTEQLQALKEELLGDVPVEAYNTFAELAAYIEEHEEAADALAAAIGDKADAATVRSIQTTLSGLGTLAKLSVVTESNLSDELKAKVNAASSGNHSHSNQALLDTYTQTNANLSDAVAKMHDHTNKSVLDGITSAKVAGWNGKANFYVSASRPNGLTANDLWVQTVD